MSISKRIYPAGNRILRQKCHKSKHNMICKKSSTYFAYLIWWCHMVFSWFKHLYFQENRNKWLIFMVIAITWFCSNWRIKMVRAFQIGIFRENKRVGFQGHKQHTNTDQRSWNCLRCFYKCIWKPITSFQNWFGNVFWS